MSTVFTDKQKESYNKIEDILSKDFGESYCWAMIISKRHDDSSTCGWMSNISGTSAQFQILLANLFCHAYEDMSTEVFTVLTEDLQNMIKNMRSGVGEGDKAQASDPLKELYDFLKEKYEK